MKLFNKIKDYLKGSVSEMKKVVWPTKKQTIRYSAIVIAMSLGMAVFFGILDYVFNIGLEAIISNNQTTAVEVMDESSDTSELPTFDIEDIGIDTEGAVEVETAPLYPTKSAQ